MNNTSVTYSKNSRDGGAAPSQSISTSTPPIVTTTRKYLQSITYHKSNLPICNIVFETSTDQRQDLDHRDFPGEQLLNSIKIYDLSAKSTGTSILSKQFNFNYSYFGDPTATDPNYRRLRLDNIQEVNVGQTGGNKPPYNFTYNNAAVPSYALASIDHWGYSNGGEAPNLVPTVQNGTEYFGLGANRDANLSATSNTVMTRITYPTGGYTQFIYELNDAKDSNGNSFVVGGLRVSQNSDYAFDTQKAIIKNYQYKLADGTTSGNSFMPQYMTVSTYNHISEPKLGGVTDPAYNIGYVTISASSISGLGSFHGSHIGYSQVTTLQTDAKSALPLGKTTSTFNPGTYNGFDDDIGAGDLISEQQFDISGKLLEEQINTYEYGNIGSSAVGFTVHTSPNQDNKTTLCQYSDGGLTHFVWIGYWETTPTCIASRAYKTKTQLYGTAYILQYKNLLDQTEKKYDPATNTYVVEEKKYTYGNPAYTYPTRIDQKTGDNEWLVTNNKYAGDYTINVGNQDSPTMALALLKSKNMVSTPIESTQYLTTDDITKKYTAGVLNIYSPTQPYLQQMYRLEMMYPLPSLQTSASNAGQFSYDPSFKLWGSLKYDTNGNLIEQARAGAVPTSYVWDYQSSLPVAEVKGAVSTDIAYTSFETGNTGNWTLPDNLRNSTTAATGLVSYNLQAGQSIAKSGLTPAKQYVVSYWSKNGVLTVTADGGSVVQVSYSANHNGWVCYQHTLPANSTTVSLTAASTKTIDELRLFPLGSQMATTTYIPLVGVSSMSTPINTVQSYRYDGLNRLSLIIDQDNYIVKQIVYNYGTAPSAPASAVNTLFYNVAAQQTFTKNTACPPGASPGTATYAVPAAKYISSVSQADADAQANAEIQSNGQALANATGTCTWYNVEKSINRLFKNDCPQGTAASGFISYKVDAGTYSSTISQADADAQALNDIQTIGQAQANATFTCLPTFANNEQSGSFTKNDVGVGYVGSTVTYTVPAGRYNSTVSQADADQQAMNDVNANGQAYANDHGTATPAFSNALQSASFTKNNCGEGLAGTAVTYTVPAGRFLSAVSQADADQQAMNSVNADGQNYANANGTCLTIYYNALRQITLNRNNCGDGYQPGTATYTIQSGVYNSTISQADADQKAIDDGNANAQNYANNNAGCSIIYHNTLQSGVFTKNDCPTGYTPPLVPYAIPAGRYSSIISQADADQQAVNDVNANGQAYANANGVCQVMYKNEEVSADFTKNDCGSGYKGSTVIYTVPFGRYSAVSQADANFRATRDIAENGQNYANTNGACQLIMFYSAVQSGTFTRNNCTGGYVGGPVVYSLNAGAYTSTISQTDADTKALADINNNGQTYANNNGTCTICTGEGYRVIGNTCYQGTKVYTKSLPKGTDRYICTYHYEWSDGYVSGDYTETSTTQCI